MSILVRDLRHSFRAMRRNPGFTAVVVLTLALGIGANTAIFSVVHAVLLRPIPYPAEHPEQVLLLRETDKNYPDGFGVAYPNFKDWQQKNRSFSNMAAFRDTSGNLIGVGEPVRVLLRQATFNYFQVLGVQPVEGRLFTEQEDRPGAENVALLNHRIWQNRFGGDPQVIGRVLRLSDKPFTVIGVVPSDIDLLARERIFIPLEPWADDEQVRDRGNHYDLLGLARLKPEVTLAQARAEMDTIAQQLEREYPATNSGFRTKVEPFNEFRTADYRLTLLLLLGAVGFVLLIACTNVANLLLARAVKRRRETAIQASLGAGRLRMVRQALTESVLLALIGAALGMVLAFWGLILLRNILPEDVPRLHQAALDWQVLGYTAVIACLTGILFGLVPALQSFGISLTEILKEAGASGGSLSGRRRLGRAFLVGEIALATVLLIGAGLLIRTISALTQVDPGFRTGNLVKMQLGLSGDQYESNEKRTQFYREIRRRLEGLPGVVSATVSLSNPMMGANWTSIFMVKGKPVPPREDLPSSIFNPVDEGFFRTFGIPLKKGRVFDETDTGESRPVVIVNEKMANRIWPGEDPIGAFLKQGWPESEGEDHPWREVVGVVGDTKQDGLDTEARMQTFIPFSQRPVWWAKITLRTEGDPRSLVEPAKKLVHAVKPDSPIFEIETMDEILAKSIAPRRFTMILLGLFAALAVTLAAVGIYGVVSYSVTGRTQEIGLRMAVGAQRRDIFRLVVWQGMVLALVGAALGIAGSVGLGQALSGLLFGVTAHDPFVLAIVPAVLALVAFLACYAPARRAVRVEPLKALRYE